MIELIVIALFLVIAGVGGTVLYDKWKEQEAAKALAAEADLKARQDAFNLEYERVKLKAKVDLEKRKQSKAVSAPKPTPRPSAPRQLARPKVVAKFQRAGDSPEDASYILEDGDISINSRQTINDLIAKLEKMKKK